MWWHDFFDALYLPLMEQRSPAVMAALAQSIGSLLELGPEDTVLEQACGIGQLTNALASRGYLATGIDLNAAYLAKATGAAALGTVFICADIFDYVSPVPSHAVINWHTSFGYSDDDNTNRRIMLNAYRSLLPRGYYLIETVHLPYILANFIPRRAYRYETTEGVVDIDVIQRVDFARGMLASEWHYRLPNGKIETRVGESRMYGPSEFRQMAASCGFESIRFFSDVGGAELSDTSPRCVMVAQRPSP